MRPSEVRVFSLIAGFLGTARVGLVPVQRRYILGLLQMFMAQRVAGAYGLQMSPGPLSDVHFEP